MPSPFPGMDPFLEHPSRFPGLHEGLIAHAQMVLNASLPPQYVADIGERVYVVQPQRGIYLDLFVSKAQGHANHPDRVSEAAAATAVVSDPSWVVSVLPEEMREAFIQILPVADESRVVTVIDVLSPANKTPGAEGRELYLTRQREILESETHLIEIDLLRQGQHAVAVPREFLSQRGAWDYLVCLHRGGQRWDYQVWPITVRDRLPRIEVPLAGDDPDVVLDLQEVFDHCYDASAYARRLDYRRDCPVLLSEADAAWADALLRSRGMRD